MKKLAGGGGGVEAACQSAEEVGPPKINLIIKICVRKTKK